MLRHKHLAKLGNQLLLLLHELVGIQHKVFATRSE